MDTLTALAALLVATAVLAAVLGVARILRWRALDQRLRDYVGLAPAVPDADAPLPSERQFAGGLQRRLSRTSFAARVQTRLVRAGVALKPSEFMLLQCGGALAGFFAGTLFGGQGVLRLASSFLLAAFGFVAPLLFLSVRGQRRLAAFERQLPQAIDAMASTLRAGSSLAQAMDVIAREMPSPISVEFRRVLREQELGRPLPEALSGLHARVPSPDLMLFTSAVAIQHRVGGDLAQIFRGISHTIRERLRVRGETRVLTAQARYSSYIIAALPAVLFLFLWFTNYEYLSGLFLPGLTRLLFGGAVLGIFIGFYAMNKIATVDV